MARQLGRLGAGMARAHARDTAKGALRHGAGPCDTAEGHSHDTIGLALGRWGLGRRRRLAGRAAGKLRYGHWGLRHGRPLSTTQPGTWPQYGGHALAWAHQCAPGRACWACWVLVHLAWLFKLVFDSVFFFS